MIAIDRVKVVSRSGGFLKFWCPGCDSAHVVSIAPSPNPWEWNGDTQRPTLNPSILVGSHQTLNDAGRALLAAAGDGPVPELTDEHRTMTPQCHSFVRGGYIEFLGDCTHDLAGQTVELGEHSPTRLRP